MLQATLTTSPDRIDSSGKVTTGSADRGCLLVMENGCLVGQWRNIGVLESDGFRRIWTVDGDIYMLKLRAENIVDPAAAAATFAYEHS